MSRLNFLDPTQASPSTPNASERETETPGSFLTSNLSGNEDLVNNQAGAHVVQRILEEFGIDTSHFGQGEAKSLMSFANEVHAGNSRLMLDASEHKKLVRVVDVVVLRLWHPGPDGERLYLTEAAETLPDGRELHDLHRLPATKKRPHENTRKCAERILSDFLHMGSCVVNLDISHRETFELEEDSFSYPGVRTVYRKEIVEGGVHCNDKALFRLLGSPGDPDVAEHNWEFEDSQHQTRFFKWQTDEQCQAEGVNLWAPDRLDEISALVPAPPGVFTEEFLRGYLEEHGVDPFAFGEGKAKSLHDFADELSHGESALALDETGQIVRFVDVVLLRLSCAAKGGAILVVAQESVGGAPLQNKNVLPGARRIPNENYFLTARRVITRQLKMDENIVDLHQGVRTVEEWDFIDRYPGIKTLFRNHIVSGEVNAEEPDYQQGFTTPFGATNTNFRWFTSIRG